jgi:ankyrin repeat protein
MGLSEILKPKTEAEIQAHIQTLKPNQKLLACARIGKVSGVVEAIHLGADLDYHSEDDSSTAIDLALQEEHYELAMILLEHGALVGNFALSNARDREDIFIRLLDGLQPEMCDHESLDLAFEELKEYGKYHLLRLLEEKIRTFSDHN